MTKPMGAIPAGYSAGEEGMLHIGGRPVDVLIAEAGDTPLFVYDLGLIEERVARVPGSFTSRDQQYSIKAKY